MTRRWIGGEGREGGGGGGGWGGGGGRGWGRMSHLREHSMSLVYSSDGLQDDVGGQKILTAILVVAGFFDVFRVILEAVSYYGCVVELNRCECVCVYVYECICVSVCVCVYVCGKLIVHRPYEIYLNL